MTSHPNRCHSSDSTHIFLPTTIEPSTQHFESKYRRPRRDHLRHNLQNSDRDALKSAAGKISTHVMVGSIVGLGLGAFLAFRLRRSRMQMFNALRAKEKPVHVKFANGREGTFDSFNTEGHDSLLMYLVPFQKQYQT